jgi:hypothetical protein
VYCLATVRDDWSDEQLQIRLGLLHEAMVLCIGVANVDALAHCRATAQFMQAIRPSLRLIDDILFGDNRPTKSINHSARGNDGSSSSSSTHAHAVAMAPDRAIPFANPTFVIGLPSRVVFPSAQLYKLTLSITEVVGMPHAAMLFRNHFVATSPEWDEIHPHDQILLAHAVDWRSKPAVQDVPLFLSYTNLTGDASIALGSVPLRYLVFRVFSDFFVSFLCGPDLSVHTAQQSLQQLFQEPHVLDMFADFRHIQRTISPPVRFPAGVDAFLYIHDDSYWCGSVSIGRTHAIDPIAQQSRSSEILMFYNTIVRPMFGKTFVCAEKKDQHAQYREAFMHLPSSRCSLYATDFPADARAQATVIVLINSTVPRPAHRAIAMQVGAIVSVRDRVATKHLRQFIGIEEDEEKHNENNDAVYDDEQDVDISVADESEAHAPNVPETSVTHTQRSDRITDSVSELCDDDDEDGQSTVAEPIDHSD